MKAKPSRISIYEALFGANAFVYKKNPSPKWKKGISKIWL
jgi:hypothetical protein